MRRKVDHTTLAAAGYFAELAVAAGTVAQFHLSSSDPATATRVVRLDRITDYDGIAWPVAESAAPVAVQTLELGAWLAILVPEGPRIATGWTLDFEFRLAEMPRDRVLMASSDATVRFDSRGALILEHAAAATGQILPSRQWLSARICRAGDHLSLIVKHGDAKLASLAISAPSGAPSRIHLGAALDRAGPTLNVGIGRIALLDGAGQMLATWRFPAVGRPTRLAPSAGDGAVLEIHNAPTFGLRSPRWDGSALDPRLRPEHYDAVALHDDDLAEAGWPETHRVSVPEDAPSGVYAIETTAAGQTSRWPFFVTPKQRRADLVFLAPTFTYLAYADERLPQERFPWLCDDVGHRFAQSNQLTSLYDTHNDGSGVSLASFRRPLVTLRDDYLYPLCGAPHLLPVDLHLLRFLNAQDIEVEILTDGDLHHRGVAALAGYRGLITGSHPEYWTAAERAALTAFQAGGGHIAYLGGNGGYWVTECDGDTIEVRRGLSGIRTWSSEPGEMHDAMSGAPGGLWRHRGRAEHQLLGTGLRGMGFSRAQPFRRTEESYAADLAWLFDGIGDAAIGTEGLVLGGAAGYEVDARSLRWGTPAQARVLAVAEGFDAGYVIDADATEDGLPEPVRAEMVLTESQHGGGVVFAASSVAWCGALPQTGTMNAVGRITLNLLRRFLR